MTVSGTQHPGVVPLRPVDTSGLFGSLEVIVYGSYDGGAPAAFQLSGTDAPHLLVTGRTGAGMATLLRGLAIGGARIGCDVRICDPKRIEMRGLRGWPGVTAVATRVEEMIALIEAAYDEMHDRYEAIEKDEAREEDYQRILLIIDMYPLVSMLISDHWHQARVGRPGDQPKEHPVIAKLRGLAAMARGAKMNLIVGTPRADTEAFPGDLRDQFGGRIALGRQTRESALLMFGDASAGCDVPLNVQGLGTAAAPGGPRRVTAGWLPDPLGYPGGFGPAGGDVEWPWSLLRAMLPEGASWDGPCPCTS
jgi:S-DNA-T family DNA segregation ATPase FtsK/SpoIIIE